MNFRVGVAEATGTVERNAYGLEGPVSE